MVIFEYAAAIVMMIAVVAAYIGFRRLVRGHLGDELMKEADENDEEILDALIRREAEAFAKKLGGSQTEAERAIRQQWDEGNLQIRQGALRRR